MSAADLPPELLQQIIGTHLSDHLPSLKACSLVSWNWRYSTLPTLFSKISVTFAHGGLGRQLSSAMANEVALFLSKWLRYILIDCFSPYGGVEDLNQVVIDLLPRFPHLSRLSILNSVDRGGEPAFVRALARERTSFSNITYFTLYRPGWPFYVGVLEAFTQLRVLHLIGINIQYTRSETSNGDPPKMEIYAPRLQELGLQLATECFVDLVNWFHERKKINLSEMKILKISTSDGDEEIRCLVDRLFALCGKHLETLDVEFYSLKLRPENYLFGKAISDGLPNLSTLQLNLQLNSCPADEQAHLKWLPIFLGRFSRNTHLQVIEIIPIGFDILLTPKRHPEIVQELGESWSTLDHTIPPGVSRFAFYQGKDEHPPSDKDEEWYAEELKRLLPLQSSKGVLQFYENGKDLWPGFDSDTVLRWEG